MKRSTSDYEAATFIVRLWREPQELSSASPPSWRGMAVHVQSGAERGLQDLDGLVNFMQIWMEADKSDR